MKWFKHLSTARNDERLARLEDKAGLEGYGFYFKTLEIVAENMDASDCTEVTYSLSRWGRQTNITSKKWLYLSSCCSDVGLMIVCRDADDITVKIPKLLKHKDNHTKNLQVTYKQEIYKEEKDKDKDKEINKEKNKEKKTIVHNGGGSVVRGETMGTRRVKIDSLDERGNNPDQHAAYSEIYENWKSVMNHPRSNLSDKHRKLISDVMKSGYSVDDIKTAIIGCSMTPHNMGANENKQIYDGLHVILKPENIDRFIGNAQKSPVSVTSRPGLKQPVQHPVYVYTPLNQDINNTSTIDGERVF
ncbi:hypothetical protein [Crenothrix polyspora]|uniref:Uncharacterized protein n=1 Tax=Crenothrix polyspora TaxID=360316 RepID=A0A1R4H164_9GAMM|nr:hypothetical protein [Crenothrix polyspora]SJM89997.1 hypothetical protein CRENPOLYSF1_1290016 [Crenothrix polyspora]